jgi:hypothetical protein
MTAVAAGVMARALGERETTTRGFGDLRPALRLLLVATRPTREVTMHGKILASILLASVMACATDSATPDDDDGDTGGSGDVSSGPVSLTGKHLEQGSGGAKPLAGATITAYKTSDDTQVATATTAADGTFALDLVTDNCDCYVKASKSGYADTYLYPAAPWRKSRTIEIAQLTSTTFSLLNTFAGGSTSKGLIIATLVNDSGDPVSGAKITSSPASGSYKYSDGTGQPSGSSSTSEDGIAFFMSAPVGAVSISASKSGMTFKSHTVTARAGALLTTEISE